MTVQVGRSLVDTLDLTDEEAEFITQSLTANTAEGIQARVVVDIYVVKSLGKMVDDLIQSNTDAATASGRYARALNFLTGALVAATLLLVGVGIAQISWR
ncbi:MAG: hypothetical protein IIB36_11795 [Gemmatimonadetes bacterium]|nr:hypothetical protein [Gemmatimonadota bacterium]